MRESSKEMAVLRPKVSATINDELFAADVRRSFAHLINSFQLVLPSGTSPSCSLCVSANAVVEECDISAAIATVFQLIRNRTYVQARR